MKLTKKLLVVLFIPLFFSCNGYTQINRLIDMKYSPEFKEITYEESLKKWNKLKAKNGNSYMYQTRFGSWTGYGYTTQITVVNDTVVSRIYQSFKLDHKKGKSKKIESYKEKGDKIGTHTKGRPAITIDEIYKIGKKHLDVDTTQNKLYFSTFENGLLKFCGHYPKNCADDCFNGVSIYAIKWLK